MALLRVVNESCNNQDMIIKDPDADNGEGDYDDFADVAGGDDD